MLWVAYCDRKNGGPHGHQISDNRMSVKVSGLYRYIIVSVLKLYICPHHSSLSRLGIKRIHIILGSREPLQHIIFEYTFSRKSISWCICQQYFHIIIHSTRFFETNIYSTSGKDKQKKCFVHFVILFSEYIIGGFRI